jgi:NTP pyrophosphatase (non-canonical NTP hydrolase)
VVSATSHRRTPLAITSAFRWRSTVLTKKEHNWDSLTETSLYIHYWAQRTFPGRSPTASLSKLILEEIPELLEHRKRHGVDGIGPELADCFILLMDLACIWNVNLKEAIRDKMRINEQRMWLPDKETGFFNHVGENPNE